MVSKKPTRRARGKSGETFLKVASAAEIHQLRAELAAAKQAAIEAIREREESQAQLLELQDLLEQNTEWAESAELTASELSHKLRVNSERVESLEMQAAELEELLEQNTEWAESVELQSQELEDLLEYNTEWAESAHWQAGALTGLSGQLERLEKELAQAREEAESARRILDEYETLAEDAEERAYQAEHDLWLAEQRLREVAELRDRAVTDDGPLQNVLRGLVERSMLTITLDHAVKQGARHRRKVALLSIGHIGAWDVAMMQPVLAKRLMKIVRDSDMLGRLDDETFGILVSEQTEVEDIRFIAKCIGRRADSVFAGPVVIKGKPYHLKVAIGVSIFPDDAPTAGLVLAHSETALAEARLTSQVGLSFYRERR